MISMNNQAGEMQSLSFPATDEEKTGTVLAEKDGVVLFCLTVIGQIEGHYLLSDNQKTTKYEHVLPLLAAVEENPAIDGLLIIINSTRNTNTI